MQEQTNVQQDLRLWLLGLLPREQGESLEQRLMTDDRAFDEVSIVEDELIDDYLSDELSEQERGAFESFFMNSLERERQFKVAKAWRSYSERDKRQSSDVQDVPALDRQLSFIGSLWGYRVPLVAVFAILFVVGVLFTFMSTSTPSGPSLAVVLEPAVQTREGGSVQQVKVPRDTQTVELRAKLPKGESKSYRAILLDTNGNTVLTNDQPAVDTSATESDVVVVPVQAERLPRGQYQLLLNTPTPSGPQTVSSYRFLVVTP